MTTEKCCVIINYMTIFGKMIKSYRDHYYIPPQELDDLAETNRIHVLVISPLLFLVGVGDLIAILLIHRSELGKHIAPLIYFSVFTIVSVFSYLFSKFPKEPKGGGKKRRLFVAKNIPVYILIFTAFGAGVYNFNLLGQPFNGVLTCCLAGFISLCMFSFSPLPFLIDIVVATALIAPGVYRNFGATGLADTILTSVLMFCLSLYKRHIEKKHIILINKQKKSLEVKTFGNFTIIYEGKVVRFSRTKSSELMGYLVYKNGTSVNTKELISVLWGDRANSSRNGSSFRNLIVDIKHTLAELEIQNFFIAEYNNFRINPEVVKCDYYDFLSGDPKALDAFAGEFMSQFSWAEDVAGFLEMKAQK